ncbi:MAG: glutamate-1-semialdehyde 2,1-aminomutase [Arcticibacterium sp.]|jgi:glutamate-1-semialdehyde 2,1-aminomutase
MNYQRSSALFAAAQQYIPGGVNSPVRAFKAVGGTPIFVSHAKGAYLYDVDGNRYVDFISSWGPLILGHAYEPVINAVIEKAKLGTSFGMPTAIETELAALAVKMVPGIEKIRFVNSGTEACMSAIRLARGFTGKDKIIKFKGCYHGHSDAFLIQAGSGAVTFGAPSSPGVTKGTAKDTLLADYNDLEGIYQLVEEHKGSIAAIIIEPVAGNMGCISPSQAFIQGLRSICTKEDILLVFDEVMTGFRLAAGGAQELLDVRADILCFGKVIGGGLPVGAFAANTEIMSHLAPEGAIYQAGTLSGNPLAMSAGLAMLQALDLEPQIFKSLAEKTAYLHKGMEAVLVRHKIPHTINRVGSMMSVHFTTEAVIDFSTAALADNETFKKYFHGMLSCGVYLPPSAYESYFLNDAISYADLDFTIAALESIADRLK